MVPSERPQFDESVGFGYTIDTARFHRDLVEIFASTFNGEKIRITTSEFDNHMPLYIVGSAEHVMYLMWLPGENFAQSFTDMCLLGSAFKEDPDRAGVNAKRLGIFSPFFDARQDKRGRKVMPDGTRAIIKGQGVTMRPIARAMHDVARADYFATIDWHSFEAAGIFQEAGLEVINLTTARLFAESINANHHGRARKRVVATLDAGDLNRAIPFKKYLDARLAIILKTRDSKEIHTESISTSTLVYGSVKGADVFLYDDSISGGGTSKDAVEICEKQGAASITLCATHPIFVKDYYKNLEYVLSSPLVQRVMITDSLPTEFRRKSADIPYIQMSDGSTKEVEVIHIGQFLADAAHTILHTSSVDEAKKQLRSDVWELQDPYVLFEQLTGLEAPRPEDVGIYLGKQQVAPFDTIYER